MNIPTDFVGTAAATLTTIAFVPQAWLIVKTRCTEGISLGTYAIFTFGVTLWLLYGVLLSAWPIVVANAITLSLSTFILFMKLMSVIRKKPQAANVKAGPPA